MSEPPAVTVEEAFDSRDSVTGENASVELRYIIRGTDDDVVAKTELGNTAPGV